MRGAQCREARVTSGLILLALIGVLVGFGWTRVRRRAGVGVTWHTWATVIAGVMILGLLLWATSVKH
jgi:hypothetical protein